MLAHRLENSGAGRPVLAQLAQAQKPISDLRAASMKMGFAFAICAALLMGAGQSPGTRKPRRQSPPGKLTCLPRGQTLALLLSLRSRIHRLGLGFSKVMAIFRLHSRKTEGQSITGQIPVTKCWLQLFLTADEAVFSYRKASRVTNGQGQTEGTTFKSRRLLIVSCLAANRNSKRGTHAWA